MGTPEPVEVCEALFTQPIAVRGELECVGEEIRTHVEISGNPLERQQEPVCVLEVEDKDRQSLEVGVWEPARHELAPLASPCCEGGGRPPPDEHAAQLVHDNLVPPPAEEQGYGAKHSVDTEELSEC